MTGVPAQAFGKYRLLRKLAKGGMAEVHLAQADGPAGFSKTLVVKRILPHLAEDSSFVEMFLNEARLAALLNHPNIVQIFDLGEQDGSYYIAMEYVDGPSLRALLRRAQAVGKPVPPEHAAKIVSLVCDGLGFAHDFVDKGRPLNLIHRDISPDNVLLSRAGSVKVVDFGIAKAATGNNLTKTGTLKGKIAYMPPEQLKGAPLDRRADIFALGIVLYELLAGAKPFDSTSEVATIQSILNDRPAPLPERRPDCPVELWRIIERTLAKDRDERYSTCRAMQQDLERFLFKRGLPIGAHELSRLVAEIGSAPTIEAPAQPRASAPTPPPPPATALVPRPPPLEPSEVLVVDLEDSDSGANAAEAPPAPPAKAVAADSKVEAGDQQAQRPSLEIVAEGASGTLQAAPSGREAPAHPKSRWPALVGALLALAVFAIGAWALVGRSVPVADPAPRSDAGPAAAAAADPASEAPAPPKAEPSSTDAGPEPAAAEPLVATSAPRATESKSDSQAAAAAQADGAQASPSRPAEAEPRAATRVKERKKTATTAKAEPDKTARTGSSHSTGSAESAAASKATLVVQSEPPCSIFVDGTPAGTTPARLSELAPGEHQVALVNKAEGLNRRFTVTLAAGRTTTETVKFGTGTLIFRVRPWAEVQIDGRPYGVTPFPAGVEVYEGERRIRLFNPELGKEQIRTVWVKPGAQEIVKVDLLR